MKIGISVTPNYESGYGRFGDALYQTLKKYGYSALDYSMVNTDSLIYTCSTEEFHQLLLHQKARAAEAGIEISQVHGPWRCPPKDSSAEDRSERLEK